MSNGSSNALPWLVAGIAAVIAAGALGYMAGRYTAPEPAPAQQAAANRPPELPPGATTEQIEDWMLFCQQGAGAQKVCFAMQEVANAEGQVMMAVVAGYDPNAVRTLVVRVPLGARLDAGVEFKVGDKDQGAFQFEACDQVSCNAVLQVPDAGYAELEKTGNFDLTYTRGNGQRLTGRVSMKGLTAAYAKIEKPVPPAAPPAEGAAPAEGTTPPATAPAEPAPAPATP